MYAVFLHAHQKIDRIAHRHLLGILNDDVFFPSYDDIIHFEGQNGPDATKLKNKQDVEQPWHFINPFDESDTGLHELINTHYQTLVTALQSHDAVRSSFEAAWLAHALVDGLTPAHHYPYEEELEALRGSSRHSRKGLLGRAYVKGENHRDSVARSLQLLGPKGLLTTHALFEGGAYTIMAPLRLSNARPDMPALRDVRQHGLIETFQRLAREIASHDLYARFYATGWTPKLSRDIRRELAPRMVQMVTLAWYSALCDAHLIAEPA